MANVLCNLPKPGEPVRYVDVVHVSGKDRLCVDAVFGGTVVVDAIKIEDGDDSGLNANVFETACGDKGLVVIPAEKDSVRIDIFQEATVAKDVTVTLSSYTVPGGETLAITGMIIGGDGSGVFELLVNGSVKARVRNSGSIRSKEVTLPQKILVPAGQVVDIDVTNIENKTHDYDSTLFGRLC